MHKPYFISGFLYNLRTRKILLLQSTEKDSIKSSWSMFGGEGREGESSEDGFRRIVAEKLKINLQKKKIYAVYDYFQDELGQEHHIFYAEVGRTGVFDQLEGKDLAWVSFGQITKLPFSPYTKQDVIVGERVINLRERELNPVPQIFRN